MRCKSTAPPRRGPSVLVLGLWPCDFPVGLVTALSCIVFTLLKGPTSALAPYSHPFGDCSLLLHNRLTLAGKFLCHKGASLYLLLHTVGYFLDRWCNSRRSDWGPIIGSPYSSKFCQIPISLRSFALPALRNLSYSTRRVYPLRSIGNS